MAKQSNSESWLATIALAIMSGLAVCGAIEIASRIWPNV